MTTIRELKLLDDNGMQWEWTCGPFDFHVQFDPALKAWVLEQFRTAIKDNDRAHVDEAECESLQDALLFGIEAAKA